MNAQTSGFRGLPSLSLEDVISEVAFKSIEKDPDEKACLSHPRPSSVNLNAGLSSSISPLSSVMPCEVALIWFLWEACQHHPHRRFEMIEIKRSETGLHFLF